MCIEIFKQTVVEYVEPEVDDNEEEEEEEGNGDGKSNTMFGRKVTLLAVVPIQDRQTYGGSE